MKEYYTMREIQLFPGLIPSVIKRLCNELGIEREKKEIYGSKSSYVLTRKQFEELLKKAGWELVNIDGENHWIRYKMKDF